MGDTTAAGAAAAATRSIIESLNRAQLFAFLRVMNIKLLVVVCVLVVSSSIRILNFGGILNANAKPAN